MLNWNLVFLLFILFINSCSLNAAVVEQTSCEKFLSSRLNNLREPRLHWEEKRPDQWDFNDFGQYLYELSPLQRKELLSQQNSILFNNHEIWAQQMVRLALGEKEVWEEWFRTLVTGGLSEFKIRTASPFFSRLNKNQQEDFLNLMQSHWPNLSKNSFDSRHLSSRRSMELFLAYQLNPEPFFKSYSPFEAYEKFLQAVAVHFPNTVFPPSILVDVLRKFSKVVKVKTKGSAILLYGSFFNGKASSSSDLDYKIKEHPMKGQDSYRPVLTYELAEILRNEFKVDVKFDRSFYNETQDALNFTLNKNWIAIEITTEKIIFYISPYLKPFQSAKEALESSPKKWEITIESTD